MISLSISTTPLSSYSGQKVKSWPPFKVAPTFSCPLIPGHRPQRPCQAVACLGLLFSVAHVCPVGARAESLTHVRLRETPWTVARQAPLSMGLSRQGHWSGLPLPFLDLPNPGEDPRLLLSCIGRRVLYR